MFAYQLTNTFPHLTTTSCAHELMNTVDHGIFLSVKYANMGNVDGVHGIMNYNSSASVFTTKHYEIY